MHNIRTVNIKGKKYVDVAERVRLVHAERESFEIVESKPLQITDMWVWQAVILVDGKRYIGTAEVKFDAPKNTADGSNPVACAETSAVGRALGMAGLGALESICSADEVVRALAGQEEPVQPRKQPVSTEPASTSESQRVALQNLFKMTDTEQPDISGWSFAQAASAIRELQAALKERNNGRSTIQRDRAVPTLATT
jgi:hypothetical protein